MALMDDIDSNSNSEYDREIEVFSDLTRSELITALNGFLNTNESFLSKLKFLKKARKDLTKRYNSLEMNFEKLKRKNLTLNEKISKPSVDKVCNSVKYELVFQDFIAYNIGRSKLASMVYGVTRNRNKWIGFEEPTQNPRFISFDNIYAYCH